MSRYFIHYWSNRTWRSVFDRLAEGTSLIHTAGEQFRRRRVKTGDFIYVVTVVRGRLFLTGRMQVYRVLSQREAETYLKDKNIWRASIHLVARSNSATPIRLNRIVPLAVVQRLRFISGKAVKQPVFESPGRLYTQTFRTLREMTPDSAAELNKLLK